MKTIITLVKNIICNVILFLTALQLIYFVINHHMYGKPYPNVFIILLCLLVATFASIQRSKYTKQ